MGFCPRCQKSFPDDTQFCPEDGARIDPSTAKDNPFLPSPPPPSPQAGWVIDGKYSLEKKLGEGGMGSVWRAKHIFMDKPCALKLLRPEVADSEEAVKRFAREAKLASQLNDVHCTTVYDCGRDPASGTLYLAMEYLEGQSLRALLDAEKRIPVPRATDIFCQLLRALGAAHAIGIVHRDVKPENVFLIPRGEKTLVKLLDFGIAKQPPQGAETQITKAGFTVGTPEYIAPEQALARRVDGRTDLYSAGIIFYEMIVGKRPFAADSAIAVVTAQVSLPPPPPRKAAPDAGIPKEVEQVILKTLAKDPKDRYQDAESLRRAISEAVFGTPFPDSSPDASSPRSQTPQAVSPRSKAPLPFWFKSALYGLGSLSLALALLVVFLLGSGSASSATPREGALFQGIDTSEAEEKLQKNNPDAALALLLPLKEEHPQSIRIRTLLAEAYARKGEWGEARAHIEVARALDAQFRGDEAIVDLALDSAAQKGAVRAEAARVFLVFGYGEEAVPFLERALKKDAKKAQAAISILGDLAPRSPSSIAVLARALNEEKNCENRLALIKSLGNAPPKDPVAVGQLEAQRRSEDGCKGSTKALDDALKAVKR